jgi:2-keto-3-deoxy-L-fuconate dehydrogenase
VNAHRQSIDAPPGDFLGLVALVTGGASGIGYATAETLISRGASVAIFDRDLKGVPDGALGLAVDVRESPSVEAGVAEIVERLGSLDVLVNNAGMPAFGGIEANDDEEWTRVLDVNVVGMVRTSRAALPHLEASSAGTIVNTCSVAATTGIPELALYSASKGAVLSLTRAMAADLVGCGIRVNCVTPGTVDSPWLEPRLAATADPGALLEALQARQPNSRLVSTEEVAEAIAFLASPRSRSTTGTALAIDGGMSAVRLVAPAHDGTGATRPS